MVITMLDEHILKEIFDFYEVDFEHMSERELLLFIILRLTYLESHNDYIRNHILENS